MKDRIFIDQRPQDVGNLDLKTWEHLNKVEEGIKVVFNRLQVIQGSKEKVVEWNMPEAPNPPFWEDLDIHPLFTALDRTVKGSKG